MQKWHDKSEQIWQYSHWIWQNVAIIKFKTLKRALKRCVLWFQPKQTWETLCNKSLWIEFWTQSIKTKRVLIEIWKLGDLVSLYRDGINIDTMFLYSIDFSDIFSEILVRKSRSVIESSPSSWLCSRYEYHAVAKNLVMFSLNRAQWCWH